MRPSAQIRGDHPEPFELRPHPTAIRLARTAVLIASGGIGVSFDALCRSGFTSAELIEHLAEAEKIIAGAP